MPVRFIANSLPLLRLYNAVVYTISASLYSVILYGLEQVSPGEYVFPPNYPERDAFMVISVISWAVMGIGAAVLIVLYIPIRSKKVRGYPELSFATLVIIILALLAISAGLAASATGAFFVYDGTRARYKLYEGDNTTTRSVLIPVVTGLLPLIFFVLMLLSTLLSSYKAVKDLFHSSQQISSVHGDFEDPFEERDIELAAVELTPEQEGKVQQLAVLGFTNRDVAIAALLASDFDMRRAETRLIKSQPNRPVETGSIS